MKRVSELNLKECSTSQLLDELRSRAEIISVGIACQKTGMIAPDILSDTEERRTIPIPVGSEVIIVKPQNLE